MGGKVLGEGGGENVWLEFILLIFNNKNFE